MTGDWLTVSRTITVIYNATGRLLTAADVLALGRRNRLTVESSHEHTRVLELSVIRYLSACGVATPSADVPAERVDIPVRQGPQIGHEAELDYERSKEDL